LVIAGAGHLTDH